MRRGSYPKFFLQSDGRENHEEQSRDEEIYRTDEMIDELNTVEQSIFDGWRYLGLDSAKVLSLTPREFTIMMAANVERTYDEYEKMAVQALMNRQGYHAKKLKKSQLFKRPSDIDTGKTADDVKERQRAIIERLERFEEFKGKFREEETNG